MTSQSRSTRSPLYYGLFRALWISSTASHIGSYMTDVGQGWLMSSLTPSPLIVSLLLTAESLPFFLFGLPAGARRYNGYEGTFTEFFERFLRGKVEFGSWFEHVKGWWKHRGDPNVLFLTY